MKKIGLLLSVALIIISIFSACVIYRWAEIEVQKEVPENNVPVADAGVDQIVYAGDMVYFNGTGYDSDGVIVLEEWDYDEDGKYDWNSTIECMPTHIYSSIGNYTATFRVTDNDGATDSDTCLVTVKEGKFAWIKSLETNKQSYNTGEKVNTTVVVQRGYDMLDVVYEEVLNLTILDDDRTTVLEMSDDVWIPSGGGTDTLFFIFFLNENGTYTIRAELLAEESSMEVQIEVYEHLLFEISMNKTIFLADEPINVTATLTNVGNENINVSEMTLGFGTLDFEIETPEGYIIHYLGPWVECIPEGVKLEEGRSINTTSGITESWRDFGNENITHYNFTTSGKYYIKGIYMSNPSLCSDQTVWNGTLVSNILNFTIISEAELKITIEKTEFLHNEWIPIKINITNNGVENITSEGYCYTFILTFPNSSQKECFCPYNNSVGTIYPGESFEQTIYLHLFSYDNETWGKIGSLPVGNYSIYAVLNSETNPWYSPLLSYKGCKSNTLNFTVVDPTDVLEFEILMNKTNFLVNESINVTAVLKYLGDEWVYVSDMQPLMSSLDFEIVTPDGYIIHQLNRVYTLPQAVQLQPFICINKTYNLRDPELRFGNESEGLTYYNFTVSGEYSIRGIYVSGSAFEPVWHGSFISSTLNFTILSYITTIAKPVEKGINDTTNQSIENLQEDDGIYYTVDGSTCTNQYTLFTDSFDISGINGTVVGAILHVQYLTGLGYWGTNYIRWALDGEPLQNTTIQPHNSSSEVNESFDLFAHGIDTLAKIETLDIEFYNPGGFIPGIPVLFDYIWIEVHFISLKVRPEVRTSENNYNETSINDFFSTPIWKSFKENYTTANYSDNLVDVVIDDMKNQAEDFGLDAEKLEDCIYATGAYDYLPGEYSLPMLPCLAEKAKFNNTDVWIIVFNRANGWEEENLSHIDIFVIDINTLETLYHTGCY